MGLVLSQRAGPFLAVFRLKWGILLGWDWSLISVTLAVWAPIGFRNPTAIQWRITPAVLIIVVDELSHRFRTPIWIQIILLIRDIVLDCITPSGWHVLIGSPFRVVRGAISRWIFPSGLYNPSWSNYPPGLGYNCGGVILVRRVNPLGCELSKIIGGKYPTHYADPQGQPNPLGQSNPLG